MNMKKLFPLRLHATSVNAPPSLLQTCSPLLPTHSLSQPTVPLPAAQTPKTILHSSVSPSSPSTIAVKSEDLFHLCCLGLILTTFIFHIHHHSLLIAFPTFNLFLSFFYPFAKLLLQSIDLITSPVHPADSKASFAEALLHTPDGTWSTWSPSRHQHRHLPPTQEHPTFTAYCVTHHASVTLWSYPHLLRAPFSGPLLLGLLSSVKSVPTSSPPESLLWHPSPSLILSSARHPRLSFCVHPSICPLVSPEVRDFAFARSHQGPSLCLAGLNSQQCLVVMVKGVPLLPEVFNKIKLPIKKPNQTKPTNPRYTWMPSLHIQPHSDLGRLVFWGWLIIKQQNQNIFLY